MPRHELAVGNPVRPDEPLHTERALAIPRLLLAAAALVELFLEPAGSLRAPRIAYALCAVYFAFASGVYISLRRRTIGTARLSIGLHGLDVCTAVALTSVSDGLNSPPFVLVLFALLAGAYRWGLRGAVFTGAATAILIAGEAVLIPTTADPSDLSATSHLEPHRWIVQLVLLLVGAIAVGYVAEREKKASGEALLMAAIMSRADVRAGLKRTMADVLSEILAWFAARKAVVVVHELPTGRLFMWEAERVAASAPHTARLTELSPDSLDRCLFAPASSAWHAVRRHSVEKPRHSVASLDGGALSAGRQAWEVPDDFDTLVGPFTQVAGFGTELLGEVSARLFLMDPRLRPDRASALRFGHRLLRFVAPAVYTVYLLHRLRSRAADSERARISRELHDGIVQTVLGVQIQLHALSVRAAEDSPDLADELGRLDAVLRKEAISLREVMHLMKPLELGPDQLVDTLADLVRRFQRETGIAARFISKLDRVPLPPRACREVARIVQEALVNVRKHSGARNVFVRFSTVNGQCVLSIDDDGRGFEFAGRLGPADLARSHRGPSVINERVRLLGGRMTVESDPGFGARLEIAVPLSTHGFQG